MTTDQMFSRLWNRVRMAIGRGRVKLVDDAGAVQKLQVVFSNLETIDGLRRVAEYGFTSHPPADSDAIAIFVAGDRSKGVVVATNHQASRLKNLQPGDAALYDNRGRWVWLKQAGIEIEAAGGNVDVKNADTVTVQASTKIVADTPLFECTGDITAAGDITSAGDVVASGISLTTHVHGGVQSGAGTTGAPQ